MFSTIRAPTTNRNVFIPRFQARYSGAGHPALLALQRGAFSRRARFTRLSPRGTFAPGPSLRRGEPAVLMARPAGRHGAGPQVAARLSGCRDKVTAALDSCLTIHTIIVFCRRYTVCSQAELGGGPGYVACTQAEDVACSSCDGPFTQPRDRVRERGPSMRSPALHRITAITRRVSW